MPEESNPYEAPTATDRPELSVSVDPEAEAIRRAHLGFEEAFKAVGLLVIGVASCFGWTLAVMTVVIIAGQIGRTIGYDFLPGARNSLSRHIEMALILAAGSGGVAAGLAFGVGLRRFRQWARWVLAVLLVPFMLFEAGGSFLIAGKEGVPAGIALFVAFVLAPGFVLYLFFARKGTTVFSPEYQAILARTPHLRYRPSRRTKGVLWGLLGVAVLGIALAVASGQL